MKFTKEEALKEIKALLGEAPQISERSIQEATETLLTFATDETELADFVEKSKPFFSTFEGNLRAEVAEKVKNAKPKDAPKPADQKPADPKQQEEEPAWFKAYREKSEQELAALQSKLSEAEAKKTVEQLRSTTLEKVKGIYTDSVINAASLNFDFAKEGAGDAFVNSCAEISKLFGVKPTTGKESQNDKLDNSDFKEQLKQDGLIP